MLSSTTFKPEHINASAEDFFGNGELRSVRFFSWL